jgi:PAS domain S-box-containing protein
MQDERKTKDQLVQELQTLRRQLTELQAGQTKHVLSQKQRGEYDDVLPLLFKCSSDMIFIYQLDETGFPGKFIEVNNVACEKLGYSRDELLNMTPFDIDATITLDSAVKDRGQFYARRRFLYETEHVAKDGKHIPVEINARIFKYQERPLVFTIVRDITERKKTEVALKESEEKYRSLVEFHQCPIYLVDKNLYYLFANRMYRKRMGIQRQSDILGKAYSDFHSQKNTREFKNKVKELTGSGTPLHYEYQSERDERKFLRTLSPVKDPVTGVVHAATVISIDITDLKKTEEALRQSETRYRCFVDRANDGIAIILKGNVVYANQRASEMLGYSIEGAMNKKISYFMPNRKKEELMDRYKRRLLGERVPSIYETELVRADGTYIPVEINAAMIPYDSGMADMLIIRDITERKKIEEHVRTSLREKEVLLQEIHHRVKNNFQVIISLMNLQAGQFKDPTTQQLCKEHNFRIRSMALVHEKLYQSENFSTINFKDYVEDMVWELCRSYRITEEVKLQIEIGEIAFGITMAIPCGLILNELVSNALKYAFPENRRGNIRISSRLRKDHKYEIIVQDDGAGMPQEIDFEATKSMGLYLVKLLTAQIGGTVKLNRKEGTAFTILFPENAK